MHINSNSSPPFCQSSTKGFKNKTNKNIKIISSLPYLQNLMKIYSFYIQNKASKQGMFSPFCLNTNMIPIRRKCVKEVHIDTN